MNSKCTIYATSIEAVDGVTIVRDHSYCYNDIIGDCPNELGDCDVASRRCDTIPNRTNDWMESKHHAMWEGVKQQYPNVFWDGQVQYVRKQPRMSVEVFDEGGDKEVVIRDFPTHKSYYHKGEYVFGFAH